MKVHVTGGEGFLGAFIRAALAEGHEVEASDLETLDVCDLDQTVAGLEASRPDVVCHLAGLTGAGASERSPREFFRVNCLGTLNVLEACRVAGVERMVFMSSLTVHGTSERGPVSESSPLRPRHAYAGSKAAAEAVVATYAASFGIRAAILRPTLVAGEGQVEANAISDFLRTALAGGTIEIFGDGAHEREWLHPADLARAVVAAVRVLGDSPGGWSEAFILSSGRAVSMRALAELAIAGAGRGAIAFRSTTRQAFSLCTATSKARDVLQWTPEIEVDEILRRVRSDLSTAS